ncbi:hypothetical protein MASR2M18_19590 [Ignavibacteria bacterium]|nr:hypothetical protein [Bacteroidota bacterium]MCZ2131844.1 hypothetical protein [Bacteroidota bacterium]
MKQKILVSIVALGLLGLLTAGKHNETILKSSGAHVSSTGAPGEKTCAQSGCHADAKVDSDDNFTVTSIILGDGEKYYTPASQYQITLRAVNPGGKRFGFQVVALDTNNRTAGAFSVPDTPIPSLVQLQSGFIGKFERQYLTHTSSGNKPATEGEIEWSFLWTTSFDYQGKITFYYCVNAANNDGENTGDHIYVASKSYTVKNSNLVENDKIKSDCDFSIYPSVTTDILTLYSADGFSDNFVYEIASPAGIIMRKDHLENKDESAVISVGDLPGGCYFLTVISGDRRVTRQFSVRR